MWAKIRSNKIAFFFLKGSVLYFSWLLIYTFFLGPKTTADERLSTNLIKISASVLRTMDYEVTTRLINYDAYEEKENDPEFQLLLLNGGAEGQQGVWVGDACNGLSLFALFSIFIISFPGDPKKKLWFIPAGIALIHLLNILRVIALALISFYDYRLLSFNHTYTFTIIVYLFIFALWYRWVTKYSGTGEKSADIS